MNMEQVVFCRFETRQFDQCGRRERWWRGFGKEEELEELEGGRKMSSWLGLCAFEIGGC